VNRRRGGVHADRPGLEREREWMFARERNETNASASGERGPSHRSLPLPGPPRVRVVEEVDAQQGVQGGDLVSHRFGHPAGVKGGMSAEQGREAFRTGRERWRLGHIKKDHSWMEKRERVKRGGCCGHWGHARKRRAMEAKERRASPCTNMHRRALPRSSLLLCAVLESEPLNVGLHAGG
jgi:hypothetical protein